MNDMLETMYAAPGIGLAAVQVGIPKKSYSNRYFKKDEKKTLYF